jgi:hypothetical protein
MIGIIDIEEAFSWFNLPTNTSELSQSTKILVEDLLNGRANSSNRHSWAVVNQLIQSANGYISQSERIETLVNCGLMAYRLGDCTRSYEILTEASQNPMNGHRSGTVKWMTGYALWRTSTQGDRAIDLWCQCLEAFEQLSKRKYVEIGTPSQEWYLQIIPRMIDSLRTASDRLREGY